MQSYNFIVKHLPDSENSAADALSRNVPSSIILNSLRVKDKTLVPTIQEGYANDEWSRDLIVWFSNGEAQHSKKVRMYAR